MPHLLVAGKLHPAGLHLLEELGRRGYTHDYVEEIAESAYAPLVHNADALIMRVQPLTAATIAKAPRLKVVSSHGVGVDLVDIPALNARGIALTIPGMANATSVAEHAMLQLLAGAKQALKADRIVREGPGAWGWRNRMESREISGKRLLILGFGRIGRTLARMAAAFEMEVRAYDPSTLKRGWPEGLVQPVTDLKEALAWADFVSIHVPRKDRPLIGSAEFAQMKPGVILATTSRGGVVCEVALAEALASGHVAAAAIDVFAEEPPRPDSPLLVSDRTILSPHSAGLTQEAGARMAVTSVQNAVDYLEGRLDPAFLVNGEALGL
ncbi:hydroxyacid dehydrogenase [Consotaella salsifontis]|uniref:D-3-phosphoglycerate dehydrogenase n=1 Tax=Consotaella salsifontis TaxID=1365950 RepID=A0A1T4RQJ9_9HYPH|nr:hydroxyacid dehydrogenase [Consotaella salsifontis]SKA18167.1 D-3-phosphoglycerate dehydrogenase [Consotaella salsifontis]